MKFYLLLIIAICLSMNGLAQNVGVGTAAPIQKMHVAGNIRTDNASILWPGSLSAAAAIPIATQYSSFRILSAAGVQLNVVTYTAAVSEGQELYISNEDGDPATFAATTIPAGEARSFIYTGGAWRRVSGNTAPSWLLTGNAGTVAGTNFLGTTDAVRLDFRTNNTIRATITSAGSIGLFTTAPATYLHSNITVSNANFHHMFDNNIAGSTDAAARFQNLDVTNGSRCLMGVTNYSASAFVASAVIGLSLNAAGTGGVGVYGAANGAGQVGTYASNPFAGAGWSLYSNGWAGGTTAWLNVSDVRLKTNIQTITGALSKIMQLRGVEYDFRTQEFSDIALPEGRQVGFIAQEVENVLPTLVKDAVISGNRNKILTAGTIAERTEHNLKAVNYTPIVSVLVEAMKEQQAMIQQLQETVRTLQNEVQILKNK